MKTYESTKIPPESDTLFHKLDNSPLFQAYKQAFADATGLPLWLEPAHEDKPVPGCSPKNINNPHPFCESLRTHCGDCRNCAQTHRKVISKAKIETWTLHCFAGVCETAVPVRSGDNLVVWLRTGHVFDRKPTKADFEKVAETLGEEGISKEEIAKLRKSFFAGRVVSKSAYRGAVTLLTAFALQLADLLNRLVIEAANAEPMVVVKARQFVNAHLEERITLDDIAVHVSVSPYYFCKVFKQATGMTLTEYVNRRRIEWAKRKLLNPQARVTEVAYDVGYQSLSQFNRSFLKYVGESPSRFREHNLNNSRLKVA
jgi:AraC-like DNA-binding protein/ligand-binding sensor protein